MDKLRKLQSDMESEKIKTELKKEQFIRKIKSGLGEHIKKNGGKVNKVKKSKVRKFWERFMDIF